MQRVFDEVNSLDKRCYEEYGLSEDILMEHAANSMKEFIEDVFDADSKVLIVCGAGNNGADGIALGRLLYPKYDLSIFLPFGTKSDMASLQLKRAELVGLDVSNSYNLLYEDYDIVVDCLFGSGLNRLLDDNSKKIIDQINMIPSYKLSCDVPSGVDNKGRILGSAIKADATITMGALKKALYSDMAKDYVGQIIIADLGVQRELYEDRTDTFLLDLNDMELPYRQSNTTHKGTFGHLAVIVGSKPGAGMLCAQAGFSLGAGLVSVVDHKDLNPPYHIMQTHKLPENTTAIAIGMGLGNYEKDEITKILNKDIPKVIDADLFYSDDIVSVLDQDNVVLTPHPKEFCSLLKILDIADVSINELQENRFEYIKEFSSKYPNVTLLLKGANSIIAYNKNIFINPHGTSILSFGGSGDVLGGFIASLLAQGYSALESAINGSLIHTKIAFIYEKNDYSMTPYDLIEGVKSL